MKIGFIIICRYNSKRLPGKILKEINNKPILQYIIERLLTITSKDNIVIATSKEKSDESIVNYCKANRLMYFRGSLNNVAERFLLCSNFFSFDYAVRINGDNIFIDTNIFKEMLDITRTNKYDFISNVKNRTFPKGMSIEIVKTSYYEKLYKKFSSQDHFEHVTLYLYQLEDQENHYFYYNQVCPEARGIQLAIDSLSDFRLAENIISTFNEEHINYGLSEIYQIYKRHKKMSTNLFKGKSGPLLIAEIGGNHEGDFEYAKKLTRLAISSNVDFIKFQLYTGNTLVSKMESPDRNSHFKKFEFTKDQHIYLAKMVQEAGIGYMASVWDEEMMKWIDPFLPIYKVGSGDLTAYPILETIAKKGKPIIISTGLSKEEEVLDAISFIQNINPIYRDANYLAVLQCTSMYPIKDSDAHLSVIPRLKELTGLTVGYSDHTEGLKAMFYAYSLGAEIIEFHFTDSRDGKQFRDHKVSLTADEVKILQQEINLIKELKGTSVKESLSIEIENGHDISFRRAIYPKYDIPVGTILNDNNLICLRPNHGIDARDYNKLLGKKTKIDLKEHQKLEWSFFN